MERIKIEEFYGVDDSSNLKRNFWGSWSNVTGLNVTEEYQWERRKDLTGVTIKATTTNVCTLKTFVAYTKASISILTLSTNIILYLKFDTLKICASLFLFQNPPIIITKQLDDGQVNVSGAFGEIWRTLQNLTNFS